MKTLAVILIGMFSVLFVSCNSNKEVDVIKPVKDVELVMNCNILYTSLDNCQFDSDFISRDNIRNMCTLKALIELYNESFDEQPSSSEDYHEKLVESFYTNLKTYKSLKNHSSIKLSILEDYSNKLANK